MPQPNTHQSLTNQLTALGVTTGATLMVHSSLGKVGWTVGGPVAVVRALLDQLGGDGTLVMPSETPYHADPASWDDPKVMPEWRDTIREHLPVFDTDTAQTTMGAIPEAFRTFPGTKRSHHPLVSVCANGKHADEITREHSIEFGEGAGTPFEKLYELDAQTLLMGVGFNRCTSLHYAEFLTPTRRTTTSRFVTMQNGKRVWVEMPDMAADNGTLFPFVGEAFVKTGSVKQGKIGNADCLLFSTRALVDFAVSWFSQNTL